MGRRINIYQFEISLWSQTFRKVLYIISLSFIGKLRIMMKFHIFWLPTIIISRLNQAKIAIKASFRKMIGRGAREAATSGKLKYFQ